jgi:aminopeptidase N
MALCVSRDYKTVSEKRGNVQVISCAWDENGAKRALEDALKALDTFSSLYGEYPYPSFTVCSADFPFGGMEYPGLCMIGSGDYLESRAESLELTVVHETAHQWFYAIVGSDQVNDPWQDEALCEYALLRYVEKRYGQGSFETLKYYRVDAAMQESVPGNLTPGSPIHYFGNLQEYSTVVYGRGAGLLLALNEMLPRGADDFLRAYARTFAFQYVSRSRFEAFLAAYAEMDAGPLLTDYLDTAM